MPAIPSHREALASRTAVVVAARSADREVRETKVVVATQPIRSRRAEARDQGLALTAPLAPAIREGRAVQAQATASRASRLSTVVVVVVVFTVITASVVGGHPESAARAVAAWVHLQHPPPILLERPREPTVLVVVVVAPRLQVTGTVSAVMAETAPSSFRTQLFLMSPHQLPARRAHQLKQLSRGLHQHLSVDLQSRVTPCRSLQQVAPTRMRRPAPANRRHRLRRQLRARSPA